AWSDWFPVEVRGRTNWRALMRVLRFEEDRYYLTPSYRTDDGLVITQPIALIQTKGAVLLAAKKWDLFIYVDTLVDRISHPYWSYMRPNDYVGVDPAKAARYADAVRNAYRQADLQLGQVLEAAQEPY